MRAGSVGARLHGVRGLAAPIAAITVFGMAMSMSYPLLSLLLEALLGGHGAPEFGHVADRLAVHLEDHRARRDARARGQGVGRAGALPGQCLGARSPDRPAAR